MAKSRPTVAGPRRAPAAEEAEALPPKELTDADMKTVTTAIRRDLWRELGKMKADEECSIQDLMNEAVISYLESRGRTITVPYKRSKI